MNDLCRCPWAVTAEEIAYHDTEWGFPVQDDKKIFEFLILEGMQAGLSWRTILNKRENMRRAFDNFEPEKIANYGPAKISALLEDAGIIRNRLKIKALVQNAKAFIAVQKEYGSFHAYLWSFTQYKPIHNGWQTMPQVPASTELSDKLSKELKKKGFSFVGSTICYSFLQAVGIINDHLISCPKYTECLEAEKKANIEKLP